MLSRGQRPELTGKSSRPLTENSCKGLQGLVDLVGFEPTTSSMPFNPYQQIRQLATAQKTVFWVFVLETQVRITGKRRWYALAGGTRIARTRTARLFRSEIGGRQKYF